MQAALSHVVTSRSDGNICTVRGSCTHLRAFTQRRCKTVRASGAIQGGEEIPIRKKKRLDVGPTLDLSKEEAVRLQIEVLHVARLVSSWEVIPL